MIGFTPENQARIVEILGDHIDPGLETDVAIRSHGIPWGWPGAVVDEAGRLEAGMRAAARSSPRSGSVRPWPGWRTESSSPLASRIA